MAEGAGGGWLGGDLPRAERIQRGITQQLAQAVRGVAPYRASAAVSVGAEVVATAPGEPIGGWEARTGA
ncbi:MAG: hypothetical protein IVW57_03960 [Ktedonobacterales bacterium]|nr:hypothetical protein [Ktedonobacterales bacterium]